jgi:hypothetical protein
MEVTMMRGMTGGLAAAMLALAGFPLAAEDTPPAAAPQTQAEVILAPFADHYEIRIEKPADFVWDHIKRLYVDGERMRQQGFAVTPVTDQVAAWLGAVRGVHDSNASRPEVTIMVAGIDEEARLLSLMIVLENPVPVYVTHRITPDGPDAAIYQTVMLTSWPVRKPENGALTAEYVREKMRADVAFHNSEVAAIMQREKAAIEALD